MNDYDWIYRTNDDNTCRYALGYCSKSPLLCVGVNPSTATPENPDQTIKSVERISKANNYNGWIMINLYPQRSKNPSKIHNEMNQQIHLQNLQIIQSILNDFDISEIWAAWGTLIEKRSYLSKCLADIYAVTENYKWVTFGSVSKAGHPHHPLYLNINSAKAQFDIKSYICSLPSYTIL